MVYGFRIDLHREEGVVIPLLACLMLGVLTIMVMVGIDAVKVKQAHVELQRYAEQICQATISKTVLQAEMYKRFSAQVNLLISEQHLKYSELKGAALIAPTMPGTSNLSGVSDFQTIAPDFKCNLPDGADCRLFTDLNETELQARYPAALWDSSPSASNAGNLAGCELSATITTLMPIDLSGTRTVDIFSKTVYWQPLWGEPEEGGSLNQYLENVLSGPGLSIAVATQMNNQSPSFDTGIYQTAFIADFAASQGFDSPTTHSWPTGVVAAAPSEVLPTISCNGDPHCIQQMRLSCVNPVVLVRNALLSTLAELASRHGQLRTGTEVLHINPASIVPSATVELTPPSLIASFGDDIADRFYQIPFIFFGTGKVTDSVNNGWINPFSSSGWDSTSSALPNRDDWRRYYAFLASQLRVCHHIYSVNSPTPTRYSDEGTINLFDNSVEIGSGNVKFEPEQPYFFSSRYSAVQDMVSPVRWDQACPWVPSVGDAEPPGCSNLDEDLTVAEVLAVLGSTRSCPYPQIESAIGGVADCTGGSALQPDIIGTLKYLLGKLVVFDDIPAIKDLSGASTHPGIVMPALQTPGLFPVSGVTNTRKDDFLPVAQNLSSVILLATHRPLRDADLAEIRSLVDDLNDPPGSRPITVLFIPEDKADVTEINIDNFLSAFNANLYQRDPLSNRLLIIGPWEIIEDAGEPHGDCAIVTEDGDAVDQIINMSCHLPIYWRDLLTDSDDGVAGVATRLFYNRLLRLELKF